MVNSLCIEARHFKTRRDLSFFLNNKFTGSFVIGLSLQNSNLDQSYDVHVCADLCIFDGVLFNVLQSKGKRKCNLWVDLRKRLSLTKNRR